MQHHHAQSNFNYLEQSVRNNNSGGTNLVVDTSRFTLLVEGSVATNLGWGARARDWLVLDCLMPTRRHPPVHTARIPLFALLREDATGLLAPLRHAPAALALRRSPLHNMSPLCTNCLPIHTHRRRCAGDLRPRSARAEKYERFRTFSLGERTPYILSVTPAVRACAEPAITHAGIPVLWSPSKHDATAPPLQKSRSRLALPAASPFNPQESFVDAFRTNTPATACIGAVLIVAGVAAAFIFFDAIASRYLREVIVTSIRQHEAKTGASDSPCGSVVPFGIRCLSAGCLQTPH